LVEVDKLGRTVAVRALEGNEAVADKRRLVYREMFDVIENIRTVSSDPSVNKKHLTQAYSRLDGAAVKYVTEELKRNPPNVIGATQTVEVEIRAAIPVSKKTWQVEWVERTYSLAGVLTASDNWKASLTYELKPSGLEESIRINPIGYTVTDISWLRII
jgi:type IV secretion system protein VirB5